MLRVQKEAQIYLEQFGAREADAKLKEIIAMMAYYENKSQNLDYSGETVVADPKLGSMPDETSEVDIVPDPTILDTEELPKVDFPSDEDELDSQGSSEARA